MISCCVGVLIYVSGCSPVSFWRTRTRLGFVLFSTSLDPAFPELPYCVTLACTVHEHDYDCFTGWIARLKAIQRIQSPRYFSTWSCHEELSLVYIFVYIYAPLHARRTLRVNRSLFCLHIVGGFPGISRRVA